MPPEDREPRLPRRRAARSARGRRSPSRGSSPAWPRCSSSRGRARARGRHRLGLRRRRALAAAARTWSRSSGSRRSPSGARACWPRSATATSRCATGDGRRARPTARPFGGISVTAAAERGPPAGAASSSSRPGAALVCPVERGGDERLVRLRDGRRGDDRRRAVRAAGRGRASEARVLRRRSGRAPTGGSPRWPWCSPRTGRAGPAQGPPRDGERRSRRRPPARCARRPASIAEPVEQARRGAVLVHAARRARVQDRHLLPLPLPVGQRRRPRRRGGVGRVGAAGRRRPSCSPTAASGRWRAKALARRRDVGCAAAVFVLNFYSPVFIDQLKRGRKTATIRLGDKSRSTARARSCWSPSASSTRRASGSSRP